MDGTPHSGAVWSAFSPGARSTRLRLQRPTEPRLGQGLRRLIPPRGMASLWTAAEPLLLRRDDGNDSLLFELTFKLG